MKYKVTYQCHEGTVKLSGPWRDRERKLEWYKKYGSMPRMLASKTKLKESKDIAPLVITINVTQNYKMDRLFFP